MKLLLGLGLVIAALLALWAYQGDKAGRPAVAAVPPQQVAPATDLGRYSLSTGPLLAPTTSRAGTVRVRGTVQVQTYYADGVTEHVQDALNGQPDQVAVAPFAEVVFWQAGNELVTTADGAGQYELAVPPGPYHVYARGPDIGTLVILANDRLNGTDISMVGMTRNDRAPQVVVFGQAQAVDIDVVPTARVRGRVVGPANAPVADVLVASTMRWGLLDASDSAQTGSDGNFELTLPVGEGSVFGEHPDLGLTDNAYVRVGDSEAETILHLTPQCVVRGRVVRADGSPASAGALEQYSGPDGTIDLHSFYGVGRIQDDGTFSWQFAGDGPVILRAWPWQSPPSAPQTFACKQGATFRDVLFRLPDARPSVFGTLHTADGRPVPNAILDVLALDEGGESQQERADESGAWSVYAMPAGRYQVRVASGLDGMLDQEITVPGGPLALTLSGAGTLTGAVKGVARGQFTMALACSETSLEPMTQLVAVVAGRYSIRAPACNVDLRIESGGMTKWQTVEVVAGQTTTLDLDLTPPRWIVVRGRVAKPDGTALTEAEVGGQDGFTHTDAAGRFELRLRSDAIELSTFKDDGCWIGQGEAVEGQEVTIVATSTPAVCEHDHDHDFEADDEGG